MRRVHGFRPACHWPKAANAGGFGGGAPKESSSVQRAYGRRRWLQREVASESLGRSQPGAAVLHLFAWLP